MNHFSIMPVIFLILLLLFVIVNRSNISKINQVKQTLIGQKNVQIMVPLKYLTNFQRTLEMTLITCEINIILTWFKECVIASNTATNQEVIFPKTDTKLYVLVVTLSTQDNAKLLQHLKSGFKKEELTGTNINKKKPTKVPNPYLDYLIDPSFHGVKRRFVL